MEYAVYGAAGELPALPEGEAEVGGIRVLVSGTEVAADWAERWRRFHEPVLIGERVWVRPPWTAPADRAGVIDLAIDPGQAFCTGAHPTPRLSLELLLHLEPRGAFADLGCGSGVLAIAVARLGFALVPAVDDEVAAVQATRENAEASGVELDHVEPWDLRRRAPPPAEVMVANLTRPLLLEVAARLEQPPGQPERLRSGGSGGGDALVGAEARQAATPAREAVPPPRRSRRAGGHYGLPVPSAVLPLASKPVAYFENAREDLVAQLPQPMGRVLDVGCGGGAVGQALRRAGANELIGIELDEAAARRARLVFDEVHVGNAESLIRRLPSGFDTVCCYDILEHLYDPASLVERLRAIAAPGAHLHVSVPNARHFSLLWDLVVRGTFGYEEVGHRDVTHLRWFTRRDIERLLVDCGWTVLETTTHELKPGRAGVTRLTRGRAREFFAVQWYVLCRVR